MKRLLTILTALLIGTCADLNAKSNTEVNELTNAYLMALRHQKDEEKLTYWLSELVNNNWQQGFEAVDFNNAVKTQETTRLFDILLSRIKPAKKSKLHDTINIANLIPESIAYDADRLFIGSLKQGTVFVKTCDGIKTFISGEHSIYGIKINANKLWVLSNNPNTESWLKVYDKDTAKLLSKYSVETPSELNDLVVIDGIAYVTDSKNGRLLYTSENKKQLLPFYQSNDLIYSNGITTDGKNLYIATLKGIIEFSPKRKTHRLLAARDNQSLAGIDGLYYFEHQLVAIQNAVGLSRVIKLGNLDSNLDLEILEIANPYFDIPTTGVLKDGKLFYIANSQITKLGTKLSPDIETYILKVPIQ